MEAKALKADFLSSIVVSLVAIPLCLGIALACGAPLFAGILSGIIGGIVVGGISKSPLSVSGPAAGMVAVVIAAITQLGGYPFFLLALALAGFLQLASGLLRAGFIANYVPTNVIQGLLAAIGILIIVKQLPLALGYYADPSSIHQNLKNAEETLDFSVLFSLLKHLNTSAISITCFSMVILLCWEKLFPRISKILPAAIVVVVVAAFLNQFLKIIDPRMALGTSHLVRMPISETVSQFFGQFQHPNFSGFKNPNVYVYAVMLAAIASLETLLNLEAVEKLDEKHRYSSRNRELVAQGIGNIASGLLGGLPVTSVIVRSSVNINAGAQSKLSTIFHGIILLISITFMSKYLNYIPLAALAAILIFTGCKLASIQLFRTAYHEGVRYFIPFMVTLIAIVFTNLLLGIIVGLLVSIGFILQYNSRNGFISVTEAHTSGNVLRLMLPQQATFLNKAAIIQELNKIPLNSKVIIDASSTDYIDNDILILIREFRERQALDKNILLNLIGFKSHYDIDNEIKFLTATTHDVQQSLTPADVLKILVEGNKRFINGTPIHKDYKQGMTATAQSQHPIAVILGCIDSRVPVELIFDLTLGDVFVARVAGNIANPDIVGSIEFACAVAKAKLIVVLGHKECGAIKAACEHVRLGNLTQLLDKIQPAVKAETKENAPIVLDNVIRANVELTKNFLTEKSDVLRKLIRSADVHLVGAIYNIETGTVEFE